MINFSYENIKELVQNSEKPAVSIYLPMERAGDETLKNPIRLKNAFKQVENTLQDQSAKYDDKLIETILSNLSEMIDGAFFSQKQLGGLAVFLAGEYARMIQIPYRFEEEVHIGNMLEVRPLLQAFQNEADFYVIALSRKKARLFRMNKFNIGEIELDNDVPTSFEEAMKYDHPEDQLQYQTVSGADGGSTQVFHGHTESDDEKKNLRRFFSMLDKGILDAVDDHEKPFLLVGLEYLQPIYRDASKLPNIFEFGLETNPDDLPIDNLHTRAWEMITQRLESDLTKAVKEYKQMLGTDKNSSDITQIPLSAAYGKVDTLLVEKKTQIRGTIDTEQQSVELTENSDTDLLRYSVNQTILHSGKVYIFDEDEMNFNESPAVAVLRY